MYLSLDVDENLQIAPETLIPSWFQRKPFLFSISISQNSRILFLSVGKVGDNNPPSSRYNILEIHCV